MQKFEVPQDQPYLTSEQVSMMMSMNPEYQMQYEQEMQQQDNIDFNALRSVSDAYDLRQPDTGATTRQLEKVSSVKQGGFLQALLPFAPLIGQLVSPLISGLAGKLFGRGMQGGAMFKQFVDENKDALKEMEVEIKMSNPKDAWKKLISVAKDIISSISGDVSDEEMNNIIHKLIPKGFIKTLITKKSGKGLGRPLNNSDLAEPILRYSLNKMIGDPMVAKKVMQQLKPNLRAGAGIYARGGLSFSSIFDIVKKGLKSALPVIGQITGKLVDIGAKPAIHGLLNKFGVKNEGVKNAIADIGTEVLKKGTEFGMNKLQGQGRIPPQFYGMPNPNARGFTSPPNARGFTAPPQKSRGKGLKKKAPLKIKLL
jgi:hypothetical protein